MVGKQGMQLKNGEALVHPHCRAEKINALSKLKAADPELEEALAVRHMVNFIKTTLSASHGCFRLLKPSQEDPTDRRQLINVPLLETSNNLFWPPPRFHLPMFVDGVMSQRM